MSAITRSADSTPSAVVNRCSGRSASSLPRMKRSTPHNRIVAMPAPDPSTVTAAYKRGLALGRAGAYFEAHEAFEEAWRACAAEDRDFYQGLVHVVVSAYQQRRGRPVAEERQRVKALRRLARYAPVHHGLDVLLLLAALELPGADPRERLVERDAEARGACQEDDAP